MLVMTTTSYQQFSYEHHPVDDIEPLQEEETECSGEFFKLQASMMLVIIDQLLRRVINSNKPKFTAWQVAYCLNSVLCTSSIEELCKKYNEDLDTCLDTCRDFSKTIGAELSSWIDKEGVDAEVCPLFENDKICMFIMGMLEWIVNSENTHLATWQIAYAIDSPLCRQSMSKQGANLGFGHGAISKGSRDFCELYSIHPSKWMQTEQFAQNKKL